MKKILLSLITSVIALGACESQENGEREEEKVNIEMAEQQRNEVKGLVKEDENEDFKLIIKSDKNTFKKGEKMNIQAELYSKDEAEAEIHHHGSKPINLRVEKTDIGRAIEDINGMTEITKEKPFSITYNESLFEDLSPGAYNVIISSVFESKGEEVNLENNLEITIE